MVGVVLLFSVIQSIIGVGVLLFGTPTLLLMGYSYHETLYLILPSSILISLLQAIRSYKLIEGAEYTYMFTLPMVFIGLLLVTLVYDDINIKYIIGVMLILISLIRGFPFVRHQLRRFIHKNIVFYNVIMGGVHGISNMGGGMLVVLMSTIHDKREVVLVNVAYTYLLFGVIQMITLMFFSQESINIYAIPIAAISVVVYMLANKFLTRVISDTKFDVLTTVAVFFYGVISFVDF